jgi:hypothetical protein
MGFLLAWGICVSGVLIAWLIGVCIHCAFMPGCLNRLDAHSLWATVNTKSVLTRGTLLAIALTFIVWVKRRS